MNVADMWKVTSKEKMAKKSRLSKGKKRMQEMYGTTAGQKAMMKNLWIGGNTKIKKLV